MENNNNQNNQNMENVLMQTYEFGKILGQGNFAKVYHGRNLITGQNVAIKAIDKEKVFKVGLIDQIKREISVMGMVKHPNIIQLYEVMATKTKIYFAMEYAKGGELFDKVAKGRLKEDVAKTYFQQLICAVDFCHGRGVYHRDLKPENLLLDEYGNLKVTDFGLSVHASCTRSDGLLHTTCGTPAYVAPEVISRRGYDGAKADIWSCGVVLYVLLTGQLPFKDSNIMQLYKKISRAEYKCPNSLPLEARKLLKRILDPNPITRISMKQIMENSWFKKGLDANKVKNTMETETETKTRLVNADVIFQRKKPDFIKVSCFNAFDIIALSSGFDLSGLFVGNDEKDEVKFTSRQSASDIISKIEQIVSSLKMEVSMKKGGLLKFKKPSENQNAPLFIDVEIYEITSSFHLVEVKKSGGDVFEYQKVMKNDVKPALEEIVFAWHGE